MRCVGLRDVVMTINQQATCIYLWQGFISSTVRFINLWLISLRL